MLHYQKTGSGNQTLVLIHGYCENNTCFHKQVLFFKDYANVIAIDLPGFGKSVFQAETSIEAMADAVKEVLDQEEISTCILLGHSMGGYVTLAFAEKYPQMLSGFGLIHSTAYPDNEERKEKRKQVMAFIQEQGKETYIRGFIPTLFKEPANKEEVAHAIQQGLDSDQNGILAAAKAMMLRPDRTRVLKEARVPVFFAAGKHDGIVPESVVFEQATLCAISQIAYLPNSAHMGMVEEPDILNQEILKFLDFCKN